MSANSPILIVGGSTTGLAMACVLARHDVPLRIIEKHAEIDPHSRATTLHSCTLEIFHDLGIVDVMMARSVKIRAINQYANGERFLHATNDDLDCPYPFQLSVEQCKTEAELERLLNSFGVTVERSTELLDFVEHAHDVVATVRRREGSHETIVTPWLIGCDGAHSRVRHINRQHFPGTEDPHQYFVTDVRFETSLPRDELNIFIGDDGLLFIIPLPEDRWLVGGDVDTLHDSTTEQPSLAEVQAMLDARTPGLGKASDPLWLSYYRVNNRGARHYRHGRVFLAGDAVHIHSPFAGLGMNTGIQDAYNLGWKLALVYQGRAPERLLDTYDRERRPVGEDTVKFTMVRTEQLECFRDLPPEQRAKLNFHLTLPPAETMKLKRHQEQLDLDYSKSPICHEHHNGGHRFMTGPRAGGQAIDAKPLLHRGKRTTLFNLLRGPQHELLLFPGAYHEAASWRRMAEIVSSLHEPWRELFKVWFVASRADAMPPNLDLNGGELILDPERALHDRYGADKETMYLIRPDGYVGYRSQPATASALNDYLASVFGT
jgi:2-polyprenyl-6-methoxyphenol hydroxylase-like FAD-dependent oxidoreductase